MQYLWELPISAQFNERRLSPPRVSPYRRGFLSFLFGVRQISEFFIGALHWPHRVPVNWQIKLKWGRAKKANISPFTEKKSKKEERKE